MTSANFSLLQNHDHHDQNINTSSSKKPHFSKKLIIIVIVTSVIMGGLSGAVFSLLFNKFFQNFFIDNTRQKIAYDDQGQSMAILNVEEESATTEVVEKAAPTVVSIVVKKELKKLYNYTGPLSSLEDDFFFNFNLPNYFKREETSIPQGKTEIGGGTGFIISSDGMIVTNKHVVEDDQAEYSVVLNNGVQYDAQILAKDPFIDLAVLKIEAKDLPVLELGDSASLKIGQTVIAIGNTLSKFKNTVTKGIISGIGRDVVASDSHGQSEVLTGVIQTDAAINEGNSGGPLINLAGHVIGINVAMSVQGQLIGFAIPINEVKNSIESVKKEGRIVKAFLGVRYIELNKKMAEANNLKYDYGALIVRGEQKTELAVIPGSPADKAGLVENDIILEIDNKKISKEVSLSKEIGRRNPGEEILLLVFHKGEEKEVKVALEEYKR